MERNIFDEEDEFESFLKEKANQYKLYPSDKVWDGVYNFFHSTRKWYTLTGTALLFTTLFFINLQLTTDQANTPENQVTDSLHRSGGLPLLSASLIHNSGYADQTTVLPATTLFIPETVLPATSLFAPENAAVKSQTGNTASETRIPESLVAPEFKLAGLLTTVSPGLSLNTATVSSMTGSPTMTGMPTLTGMPITETDNAETDNPASLRKTFADKKDKKVNWLQEMAAIRLSTRAQSRFGLQFYLSPTAGYRRLRNHKEEVNTKVNNISPLSGDPVNIDGIVDHHPAIGMELGSSLLFNASKKLTLKAGLQLNYVRYAIQAYKSYPEKTAITLSSVGPRVYTDTITAYTSIRNLSGRYPENLQNQYVQISLPIGAELRLLGDNYNRFQLKVAGTIQPTYLLLNNTYLLTSDYGNYTKDPGLVRKWNVNAAIETFISYRAGGLRWQLGPQFRYQLLSTYNDLYPIREYLMEYGVKIGVSKTF